MVYNLNETPLNSGIYYGAIARGEWKMIIKGKTVRELYNLIDDEVEANDVAADNPEIIEELEEWLQASLMHTLNQLF